MANTIFSAKDLKPENLNTTFLKIPQLEEKKKVIANWQKAIANGKVQKSKEEQIKSDFLNDFFGKVLGYSYEVHESDWNLEKEFKSITDNKKPDAALGFFNQQGKADVRCVIEVKGALVNLDKKQNRADFQGSSVDQAFNYVHRMPGKCDWVIVTNMIEIRFYHRSGSNHYESFEIPELLQIHNLQRFFYLLSHNQLFLERGDSKIDQIFYNRQAEQKKIGAEFYNQYKDIRLILFANLYKENAAVKPKDLFRLTQKLIDRLIFIGFVRDLRLVDNVLTELNQNIKTSFRKDNQRAWGELKELFNALNEGYTERNIPPFNGELFKPDALLDNLIVRDHQILPLVKLVQDYDFQSQLDVNILGHIFEQSIADLPEILEAIQKRSPLELAELTPETANVSKRKKDGIFYTPDYITHYMVKEAVGGWLDDRKREILQQLKVSELPEPEFADYATIKVLKDKVEANETILLNIKYWQAYEQKLASIKVVDPACGSGAFLNAVFDFLYNEWARVVKPELKKLTTPLDKQMLENSTVSEPIAFTYGGDEEWRIKKNIIVNNIYGVDLNGESVEITKLSLWLKTANKTNSLAALYDNVKQGNSLIDDPKVAGDDAFDWHKAYPQIFSSGGFDVVVGNPPYVRNELLKTNQKEYFENKYSVFTGKADLYVYFYEGSSRLLKSNGYLSFITPSKYLRVQYGDKLKDFIRDNFSITKFIDFKDSNLFDGISAYPSVIVLTKQIKIDSAKVLVTESEIDDGLFIQVEQSEVFELVGAWSEGDRVANLKLIKLLRQKFKTLGDLEFHPQVGIKTGLNEAYIVDTFEKFDSNYIKPYLLGRDVKRYSILSPETRIICPYTFGERLELFKELPKNDRATSQLVDFKDKLSLRAIIKDGLKTNSKKWFEFQQIKVDFNYSKYIVYPDISERVNFTFCENVIYDMTCFGIESNSFSLLAILNSKLVNFYLSVVCAKARGGYLRLKSQYISTIPIPTNFSSLELNGLSEKMLDLNKSVAERAQKFLELLQANFVFEPTNKLKKWYELEFIDLVNELEKGGLKLPAKKQAEWLELFKTEKEKINQTQLEIAKTDHEIDQLVYSLYQLTPEEIAIVERG